ncbi:MAG: DUF3365 domain-containing protein [Desulfuromonadaceae bacterium]|nr:DUF3365 domain-containing protein [Desulfuromonadaceae bacterium]MDD2848993.1 DUF3365 domain-containing protein [Desulfuromonadaceae bacterium]MDD4130342.1 DUF3365 domain-containing protein [Desulfuromonadaceae bacterium]
MEQKTSLSKRYALLLGIIWTLLLIMSSGWDYIRHDKSTKDIARAEGYIAFQKDTLYRKWASNHGGVYVPVTEQTQPNPSLSHIPERDITTPSGKRLTLINPAYMTRQVFEMADNEGNFVKGHITSLNPIRPENAPDSWERNALKAFEGGAKEVSEIQTINGQQYMRFMRPFIVDDPCLKCHAPQGYKRGDLRGGISVSVPMAIYTVGSNKLLAGSAFTHFMFWIMGIGLISYSSRRLSQSYALLRDKNIQLEHEIGEREVAQENLQEQACQLEEEILERQQTQHTLAQSEERFRTAIINAPFPIMIHADDGQVVQISSTWTEITGYTLSDIPTIRDWVRKAYGVNHEVVEAYIDNLYNLGARIDEGEYKITTLSGETRIWDFSSAPLGILSDGRRLVISIAKDITDRKLTEDALRTSKERLERAEQVSKSGNWELHLDSGKIISSKGAAIIYGVENDSLEFEYSAIKSMPLPEYRPTLDAGMKKLMEENGSYDIEFKIKIPNTEIIKDIHSVATYDREKGIIFGIIQDITANKRLEAQLQQAQKMEAVGRLAGGVAHDFNNMLTIILGHAQLALMGLDPALPLNEHLTSIQNAAERSADLTRQLLAFARKQTIAPKVLDLNESVSDMLKMLQRLIGEDIRLTWQPGTGLWQVMVDPSQIDQVLANLCVNARDAITDVGMITIATGNSTFEENHLATDDHPDVLAGEYVWISVNDDGCGISKEAIAHIFEPFFTTKAPGEGTGLGLATVFGIVKQNNGFINVYSEPGMGASFKIYFPRHLGQTEYKATESAEVSIPRGEETILVVEDESAILNMARMLLEKQGYTVLAANSPGEAIRLSDEYCDEIHLLMTDVIMPGMNGRDLAKTILLQHPNIKCLFMSGYTADVIAHHGVLEKGVYFIQKPFSLPDLAIKVKEVLNG